MKGKENKRKETKRKKIAKRREKSEKIVYLLLQETNG